MWRLCVCQWLWFWVSGCVHAGAAGWTASTSLPSARRYTLVTQPTCAALLSPLGQRALSLCLHASVLSRDSTFPCVSPILNPFASPCSPTPTRNCFRQDAVKYLHQDILVPGPFTISASLANASRELCDGVHQQWDFSLNINKVNLGDQISSLSFVHGVTSVSEHLEEVAVTTLGLKNMHRDILMTLYATPQAARGTFAFVLRWWPHHYATTHTLQPRHHPGGADCPLG